ncbi:MAG TPA: GyrI-like domain-containing protein [Candidatus Acidoferrum sp.]|nr:GyrI-like domain-containing protein [Candidatus Acidoferrum sp.]
MNSTNRLQKALDYLESSLELGTGQTAELEAAARLAHCSPFHFLRLFDAVFDTTPIEYVRRRRLSRAAMELAAGKASILDIALHHGYETPEAFTKAFKRLFGLTPSAARSRGATLTLYPPLRMNIERTSQPPLPYRIVAREAFAVVGVGTKVIMGHGATILDFWQTRRGDGTVAALVARRQTPGLIGVCYDYGLADLSFYYLIGIVEPVNAHAELPSHWQRIDIPAADYAVFTCDGPLAVTVKELWRRIYTEWFPESGWEHAPTPQLQIYTRQYHTACSNQRCELWIPLQAKPTRRRR